VLSRCSPGVPAAALLPLLDGAGEFGAELRARGVDEVQWAGPLSEYVIPPIRTTARELAKQSDVADFIGIIRTEAERLLDAQAAGRPPAAILVGGPGAVWPFAGIALGGLGPVWQSLEPELDLAVGACWWTQFRRVFGSLSSGILRLPSVDPLAVDGTQLPSAEAGAAEQDTDSSGELLTADWPDLSAAAEDPAAAAEDPAPAGPAEQPGILPADWSDLSVTPETGGAEDHAGTAEEFGGGDQSSGDADETFVEDIMRNIRTRPETSWE
jgi:hypothetical protein